MIGHEILLDGLHQYAMHLYTSYLKSGLSEEAAKQKVASDLRQEAQRFHKDRNYITGKPAKIISLEMKVTELGSALRNTDDEQERFRLLKEIEECNEAIRELKSSSLAKE